MSNSRTAVCVGSFDPPTNGHHWVFTQGVKLFDRLVIGIGSSGTKTPTFTLPQRILMLEDMLSSEIKSGKVIVKTYQDDFLVNFASENEAQFVLRGIRSEKDYEYERDLNNLNNDLGRKFSKPEITTVFVFPPRELCEVSSSMVKSLVKYNGWEKAAEGYVSDNVLKEMIKKFSD